MKKNKCKIIGLNAEDYADNLYDKRIYCGPTWGVKKMINLHSDEYEEFKRGTLLLLELGAPIEELHGELDSIIYEFRQYRKMIEEGN